MEIKVICLEEAAFYELVRQVVNQVKQELSVSPKWVSGEEAMKLLKIKSKTTLQQLRDKGRIRFSQLDRRNILYDTVSLNAYIERHARNTF